MKTQFKIGHLSFSKPIVQGGMGIGVSLSNLAGHVSKNGGLGVLSAVEMGFDRLDYLTNKREANRKALFYHFNRAKEIANQHPVGINIMTALTHYEEIVKNAVEAKIDIIFAGAGLPLNLPALTKDSQTKISPIVSSGRVAKLILKHWWRHYTKAPDAIVLEGPLAGGHLGFKPAELRLDALEKRSLPHLIKEILEEIKPYEDRIGESIPLIAGGGLYSSTDVLAVLDAGANAVQIGTRFIATFECDASQAFKDALIHAQKSDIQIIDSPAGFPGRAIINQFLIEAAQGKQVPEKCSVNCLKSCDYKTAPYCISRALIAGRDGNLDHGFVFCGANGDQVKEMSRVKNLMDELLIF